MKEPGSFLLQCDVAQFFPSIDHDILFWLVGKKIKCPRTLTIIRNIISESPCGGTGVGLPIGNLTSQLFANVILNSLDHFCKETLGCGKYLRYCDDFVCVHADKQILASWRESIEDHLDSRLGLQLHRSKRQIFPARSGANFLGFQLYPQRRRLSAANARRFTRRLARLLGEESRGGVSRQKIVERVMAWQAHANHAGTLGLQRSILGSGPAWVRDLAPA
jgi:retron-type reverse transcriptase